MSKKNVLTIGADPELMLIDKHGSPRSAIPVVKGSKENKIDLGNGQKMFYDNVLCEFNILPASSPQGLILNITDCLRRAAKLVRPLALCAQASAIYPAEECQHPEAKVFGCEPECCAYEVMQMGQPICEEGDTFRSAGGHIHLGYSEELFPLRAPVENKGTDEENCEVRDWGRIWVIRMMDLFVGIPALFVDHDPTSKARRRLYGKAGSHRPKDYGVEYRSTSNFWLHSPRLTTLIFNLSSFVVNFVAEQGHLRLWKDNDTCTAYDMDDLKAAINDSDQRIARKFMESLVKKYLPTELFTEIFALSEPTHLDFYREWGV